MLLPFNTSTVSNLLVAPDQAAQGKALIAPFKEEFDGSPEDVLQHITSFNTYCVETGVTEDFSYFEEVNQWIYVIYKLPGPLPWKWSCLDFMSFMIKMELFCGSVS